MTFFIMYIQCTQFFRMYTIMCTIDVDQIEQARIREVGCCGVGNLEREEYILFWAVSNSFEGDSWGC